MGAMAANAVTVKPRYVIATDAPRDRTGKCAAAVAEAQILTRERSLLLQSTFGAAANTRQGVLSK